MNQACDSTDIRLLYAPGIEITASCKNVDSTHMLHLSVTAADPQQLRGPLRTFSLGFCGELVRAAAPAGWTVTIPRMIAAFGQPALVEWTALDAATTADATLLDFRVEGFSLVLKPGWRRAGKYVVTFRNGSGGSSVAHDCGEWPM
jgi:hypothetical protein